MKGQWLENPDSHINDDVHTCLVHIFERLDRLRLPQFTLLTGFDASFQGGWTDVSEMPSAGRQSLQVILLWAESAASSTCWFVNEALVR